MTVRRQPQFRILLGFLLLAGALWLAAEAVARLGTGNGEPPPLATGNSQTTTDNGQATAGVDATGLELIVPVGFRIETFADGFVRPRVLLADAAGVIVVSDQQAGTILALPDGDGTGAATMKDTLLDGLNEPHGLVFLPDGNLAVAETDRLSVWRYSSNTFTWEFDRKLADLPSGDYHTTRSLALGTDGRLYVSIGSSCNICTEDDERRAAIYRINLDGTGLTRWAWGLRNTVFFQTNPLTGQLWGNDMGRDLLGDDLPPDELNSIPVGDIEPPGDYGWPNCYGDRVVDPFGNDADICTGTVGSHYEYPAHVSPLGIEFIPAGAGWPAEWEGDVLVAWHGSSNRSEKIGYKVVRLALDADQRVTSVHNFVTGFLRGDDEVVARPAGLFFAPDGALYIADDHGGRIFRVRPL